MINFSCSNIFAWLSCSMLLFASCEQAADWQYVNKLTDTLIVVDGMITNEAKAHVVKISRLTSTPNDTSTPISGAVVRIFDNFIPTRLTETPAGKGIYVTKSDFSAQMGRLYTLQITYNGKQYKAHARMEALSTNSSLSFARPHPDSLYRIVSVAPAYDIKNATMYDITLDWSSTSYCSANVVDCKKRLVYYTLPLRTIDVNYLFAPVKDIVYFPSGTKIIKHRYSLTRDHANFIRTLLAETEWRGGYFDVTPTNIETNMSSGALGYFSVCMVAADTLITP